MPLRALVKREDWRSHYNTMEWLILGLVLLIFRETLDYLQVVGLLLQLMTKIFHYKKVGAVSLLNLHITLGKNEGTVMKILKCFQTN